VGSDMVNSGRQVLLTITTILVDTTRACDLVAVTGESKGAAKLSVNRRWLAGTREHARRVC
jgi:hypothetical protein